MSAPIVIHPRAVGTHWTDMEGERVRLVIPAAAAEQLDALPVPEVLAQDVGEWAVVYLGGESVEVLDLSTRKRWKVRRGQCGMGSCCCDAVAWPADYTGPIPPSEPFDAWAFNMEEEDWDALAVECGRDVSELGWDELLAAVAEVHGQA